MMRMQKQRPGYTLVELMVVIAILVALAGLTLMLVPSAADRRAERGVTSVIGWLNIARQRAFRDQTPSGVRLYRDTDNKCRTVAYIMQPEDLTSTSGAVTVNTTTATIPAVFNGLVEVGDWLHLSETSQVYRFVGGGGTAFTLDRNAGLYTGNKYRIVRQPRPFAGEEPLQLPADVVIDLPVCLLPPPRPDGHIDLLFGPSMGLVGPTSSQGTVVLWVRTDPPAVSPEQGLIAIYSRTGRIASFPVAPGADPYLFVKDGSAGGL
jgi:prepilin-type N-terminal cleavage/methylation domain-containing protein